MEVKTRRNPFFALHHHGQLTRSEAVPYREGEGSDEGLEFRNHKRAFDDLSSHRIGPVQNINRYLSFGCGLENVFESGDVGVKSCPDILNIVD